MTTLCEFRGTRYTIRELAEMSGISTNALYVRLANGWTIEQAMCIPTPSQIKRGVVFNFPPLQGTGAGGTAQEIPKIGFSEKANAE